MLTIRNLTKISGCCGKKFSADFRDEQKKSPLRERAEVYFLGGE
jgi:hypothetical protein